MTTINDIRFNRLHCKELLEQNKIDDARVYIKKFFFSFQNKIFFNDGIQFILYPREEALKLIPNDLKTSVILPNEQTKKIKKFDISLKDYIKNCEFMDLQYIPTIDFEKSQVLFFIAFNKNVIISILQPPYSIESTKFCLSKTTNPSITPFIHFSCLTPSMSLLRNISYIGQSRTKCIIVSTSP